MPPPEVRAHLQMTPTQILRIAKAIYGLLNAPKAWNASLCSLRSDGWIQHQLDQCLFKIVNEGEVVGYLGIHADDVITTGSGAEYEAALTRLTAKFKFGSWDNAQETTLTYCGCEIRQDQNFGIQIKQERFSQEISDIVLSQERRAQTQDPISTQERTEIRQRFGPLKLAGYSNGTLDVGNSVSSARVRGERNGFRSVVGQQTHSFES